MITKMEQKTISHCDSILNESVIRNCDILREVYIAMKLRREPSEMMRVKLYPPEIAYEKLNLVEEHHELSMSSNRIITSKDIRIRNPPTLEQNIVHIEIFSIIQLLHQ